MKFGMCWVMLIGLISFGAGAQDCVVNAQRCTYYQACVESRIPCGNTGYALGYGQFYCRRFNDTFDQHRKEFSFQAHEWRISTARCLQRQLGGSVERLLSASNYLSRGQMCRQLKDEAYDQHATCYTQSKNSICFLPISDVQKIMKYRIIAFKDLFFSLGALTQMMEVQSICMKQLGGLKNSDDERLDYWSDDWL